MSLSLVLSQDGGQLGEGSEGEGSSRGHPTRKQVCDFIRILLMDSLLNISARDHTHPLLLLLEVNTHTHPLLLEVNTHTHTPSTAATGGEHTHTPKTLFCWRVCSFFPIDLKVCSQAPMSTSVSDTHILRHA